MIELVTLFTDHISSKSRDVPGTLGVEGLVNIDIFFQAILFR